MVPSTLPAIVLPFYFFWQFHLSSTWALFQPCLLSDLGFAAAIAISTVIFTWSVFEWIHQLAMLKAVQQPLYCKHMGERV